MTELLKISPTDPDPDILAHAGDILQMGGLVAYPTETVYGLAASAFVVDSVARVFDAKQRPFGQALPVQIAGPAEVETLARSIPAEAKRLIADFFPGPLTLVLWRLPSVSLTVTGGSNTIGLRMPDHPVALGVLRAFGAPLVCPSANLTGRRAPMSARDVLEDLDGRVDLVLDGGETQDRTPSTVLDLTTQPARLLREGKIGRATLAAYVEIAPSPGTSSAGASFGYNNPIVPTFLRILTLLRPYQATLVFGFVCLLGSVALELAPPLVWKVVVDDVIARRQITRLWTPIVVLTLIAGGSALLSAVRSRLLESVGQRFVYDLRNTLYLKLSHQSLAYFNEARTGDLMSRASSDVDAVQEVVIRGTDSIIANFLRLAGVAVIFCALNLKLGLATLLPILLVGVFLKLFNKRVKGVYKAAREKLGLVNAKLQDNLSGIRIIKAFAREEAEAESFARVNQRYLQDNLDAINLRATFFPFVRWIASFGNTITIGYGAWLILHGQFTVGGLVAYRGYGRYFFGPIDDLTQINDTVQRAVAAGNRIFAVLDAPTSVTDAPDASELPPVRGEIVFEDVEFRYRPDTALVLDRLSLHIEPGQTAALVGDSGAGKSTLFALVSRFWDPDAGRVLVDGHDLRDVTQHSLRRQIASVQQETFLFGASIAENIRYARPDASDTEVEDAARAANAHEFIFALPDGYATLVGERGVKLSGGQRQRLSVARAFLADPAILLLDEATSAVEPDSERVIQDALARLMRGRTTILAAHRLSTVRHADVIFVLEHGRLAEQGTHDELIRRGGRYAHLVSQQHGALELAP